MAKRVWGKSGQHSFIAATLQRDERHPWCPSQHLSPGASLQLGMGFLLLGGTLRGSMRKLWVPPGHLGSPCSQSSPLSHGAAPTLAKGGRRFVAPRTLQLGWRNAYRAWPSPQILHSARKRQLLPQAACSRVGALPGKKHRAQTKGEKGRSEPPWDVGGGMLCLQSLCQS